MQPITTEQIKQHRKEQKESGVVGCKNGDDMPLQSLKGISWRPADPMNPSCFCHDCRTTWDPEGSIDLEVINKGNEQACVTYASIIPDKKETLMVLRCATDDALEDFVAAQMELVVKMDDLKSYQEMYDGFNRSHSALTSRLDYTFLKTYESEIDKIESDLKIADIAIRHSKEEVDKAEAKCRETEDILRDARKTERDFFDKNF